MARSELNLGYYIAISIDYHQRRISFFDWWHKIIIFLGIVFGSGAAAAILAEEYRIFAAAAALVIVVLNALELVFGISAKARLHSELRRRWIDLETELGNDPESEEHRKLIQSKRNAIETDEPPVKKMVMQLSANAYHHARGNNDQKVHVPYWIELFAHYINREFSSPSPSHGS